MALKNHLDPDATMPEDILLLNEDGEGNMEVLKMMDEAKNKLGWERSRQ